MYVARVNPVGDLSLTGAGSYGSQLGKRLNAYPKGQTWGCVSGKGQVDRYVVQGWWHDGD